MSKQTKQEQSDLFDNINLAVNEVKNLFQTHPDGILTLTRYLGCSIHYEFQIWKVGDEYSMATEIYSELRYIGGYNDVYSDIDFAKQAAFEQLYEARQDLMSKGNFK